ncbi:MAG: 2'-5' RNA ligase family protein [Flavisolibacter sp.]
MPDLTMPQPAEVDYLLVLMPHKDLFDKIMRIKQDFAGAYHTPVARATESQLPLARFTALAAREKLLLNRLENIFSSIAPFPVELRNFGALPSHTIYFSVATRKPIDELVKAVREIKPLVINTKARSPYFFEEHHITLCHKLKPWQFEEAWRRFASADFSGRFVAAHARLLRRTAGEKYFSTGTALPLLGKAGIKQGDLFS